MEWFAGRGFTPYGEVPFADRTIDVVGVSASSVEAVELKLSLTVKVIHQALLTQLTADRSWCAVPTRPRRVSERLCDGLGLLMVSGGRVEVLVEAQRGELCCDSYRDRLLDSCQRLAPYGKAGIRTLPGEGPAQRVYDAVEAYRAENPRARWEQIFAEVSNHYAHAKSMQSAMRSVQEGRAARGRREAAAAELQQSCEV